MELLEKEESGPIATIARGSTFIKGLMVCAAIWVKCSEELVSWGSNREGRRAPQGIDILIVSCSA